MGTNSRLLGRYGRRIIEDRQPSIVMVALVEAVLKSDSPIDPGSRVWRNIAPYIAWMSRAGTDADAESPGEKQ